MKLISVNFRRPPGRNAFSLVEVVVAVGIFALAIVAVIGLLAPLGSSVMDVRDGDDASRVATTIQSGLQEEVNRLKQDNPTDYWSKFATYLDGGTIFYASRDGSIVGRETSTANVGAGTFVIWDTNRDNVVSSSEHAAKFFEVTLNRNTTLSPSGSANDSAAGYLAFNITLRWPGYLSDGSKVTGTSAATQQSVLILPAAVVR